MLFSFVKANPLLITDYTEEDLHFRFLYNGDQAFKDTDRFITYDVPLHYEGSRMLRTNERFNKKEIKIRINKPSNLFIAVSEKAPHYLPE